MSMQHCLGCGANPSLHRTTLLVGIPLEKGMDSVHDVSVVEVRVAPYLRTTAHVHVRRRNISWFP